MGVTLFFLLEFVLHKEEEQEEEQQQQEEEEEEEKDLHCIFGQISV